MITWQQLALVGCREVARTKSVSKIALKSEGEVLMCYRTLHSFWAMQRPRHDPIQFVSMLGPEIVRS